MQAGVQVIKNEYYQVENALSHVLVRECHKTHGIADLARIFLMNRLTLK